MRSEVAQEADGSRGHQDGRGAENSSSTMVPPLSAVSDALAFRHSLLSMAALNRSVPVSRVPLGVNATPPAPAGVAAASMHLPEDVLQLDHAVAGGARSECRPGILAVGGGGGRLQHPAEAFALVSSHRAVPARLNPSMSPTMPGAKVSKYDGGDADPHHGADDHSDVAELAKISKTHDVFLLVFR